jgi:hypothetical protein
MGAEQWLAPQPLCHFFAPHFFAYFVLVPAEGRAKLSTVLIFLFAQFDDARNRTAK